HVISQRVDLNGYQLKSRIKTLERQLEQMEKELPPTHPAMHSSLNTVSFVGLTTPAEQKQTEVERMKIRMHQYKLGMNEVDQFYVNLIQSGDPTLILTLRNIIKDKDSQVHTANIPSLILQLDLSKHRVLRNFNSVGMQFHTAPELLKQLAERVITFISRSDWGPSLIQQLQIYMWSAGGLYLSCGERNEKETSQKTIVEYCNDTARNNDLSVSLSFRLVDFFYNAAKPCVQIVFKEKINDEMDYGNN
ncbi:hypothetical protein RFI_19609, partial [Reticulomyxa filosa]